MQLGRFTSLIIAGSVLFFSWPSFSQTEEMLNSELNAAEGAAGGGGSAPKELKSNGGPTDALGIPSETEETIPEKPAVAPPVQPKIVQRPAPPPPKVAPPPAPPPKEMTEQAPPPPVIEEAPPAETNPEVAEPSAPGGPTEAPKEEAKEQSTALSAEDEDEATDTPGKNKAQKICNCKFKSDVSYRDRRSAISGFFGLEGGTYSPTNYVPAIVANQTFSNYYSNPTPNMEIVFGAKWNFLLGSLGVQVGGGYFGATANDGSKMTVYPITTGLIYAMDSLFKEPYVVPYAVGGVYTDFYSETSQGLSVSGRTSFAGFYAIGLMFQLDWIDPETHESGYEDFGLENTYLFIEARSFLPSNDYPADLSTPLQVSGGFRFEF